MNIENVIQCTVPNSTADCLFSQSKISIEGDKFVEHHKDKEDPTLDAVMIREVNGDKLIVVSILHSDS